MSQLISAKCPELPSCKAMLQFNDKRRWPSDAANLLSANAALAVATTMLHASLKTSKVLDSALIS